MGLDIRWPIGLMFSIVGLLMAGYGLLSGSEIYKCSLGININLIWGIVLLVFGGAMLALAKIGAGKAPEDKK
jgi:hypothetical protein